MPVRAALARAAALLALAASGLASPLGAQDARAPESAAQEPAASAPTAPSQPATEDSAAESAPRPISAELVWRARVPAPRPAPAEAAAPRARDFADPARRAPHAADQQADVNAAERQWPSFARWPLESPSWPRGERWQRWRGQRPLEEGGDLYLKLGASARVSGELRSIPSATGTAGPSAQYFGSDDQQLFHHDAALTAELWRERGARAGADWRVHVAAAIAFDSFAADELGIASPDLTQGDSREDSGASLERAWAELRLGADALDPARATWLQAGILPLCSDFRGFVYSDANLGLAARGALDAQRWSWQLALQHRFDRDTNTGLLELDEDREQDVLIARLRADDWMPFAGAHSGFASEFSLAWSADAREEQLDDNGFPVTPEPIGSGHSGRVEAFYLGWCGEGRIDDRWSLSHALFEVLGTDEHNALAAREVEVNAQLGALELGYTRAPWRLNLSLLHASGDPDARDGSAQGFDGILEQPDFAGGALSLWSRASFRLAGTNLSGAWSPLPDLATAQGEGQQSFVNPGLDLVGASIELWPSERLRLTGGINYLLFDETDALETLLQLEHVAREIGWEGYAGLHWRPARDGRVALELGASALLPGDGLEHIYQDDGALFGLYAAITAAL